MKRRNFLANTSLVMTGLFVPPGLSAMQSSNAGLSSGQLAMLVAFRVILADYPGSAELKAGMASVASVEYADESTLRFRSATGERNELRRVGNRVVARLLA